MYTYINGILRILIIYEGKSPRPPRLMIVDNLDLLYWPVLGEHISDLLLPRVETQAEYTHHSTRARVELNLN